MCAKFPPGVERKVRVSDRVRGPNERIRRIVPNSDRQAMPTQEAQVFLRPAGQDVGWWLEDGGGKVILSIGLVAPGLH